MATNTILAKTKIALGIPESVLGYDDEILMHLNALVPTLVDLDVCGDDVVIDENTSYSVITTDPTQLLRLPIYMTLRVKIIFDATASPTVKAAYDSVISNMESRMTQGGG